MSEIFVQGPQGYFNLRFVRSIHSHYNERDQAWSCSAKLDEGQRIELYDSGTTQNLSKTVIPGEGYARVVHWLWDKPPEEDEVSVDHLCWHRTRIIGWQIDMCAPSDEPIPILVDPPARNGDYVIEEPDGKFLIQSDRRLSSDHELQEWALERARFHAQLERKSQGKREAPRLEQNS